jgi:high-affinity iron transporter
VNWAEAVPNLLIGLREGLEAGLVVSILLAALRKTRTADPAGVHVRSSVPVWLGVLGAVMLAGSFAAVLTFSTSVLSSRAQEAAGGLLSVLAVALVTGMIFWMRRTAATLSKQLRGEVQRAAAIGAGALTITAFLAVGREGLETTLFLWTAAKASGSTLAPLAGAGLGLAAAVVLCSLLYRQAVRLNIGVFFTRTALALIVIAAGVLAYGLGDLQDAGLLSGQRWIAFDVTAHADPGSWWVSLISGVTELAPKMTVLQVVAWIAYLAVVIPLFARAGRTAGAAAAPPAAPAVAAAPSPTGAPPPAAASAQPATAGAAGRAGPGAARWERLIARRPWTVAGVLVLAPVLAAAVTIAALPPASAAAATVVTVTATSCAPHWSAARTGTQTFSVANKSGQAGEVNLVNSGGGVVAEIETIGPATTATMTATLTAGSYVFRCYMGARPVMTSASVQAAGRHVRAGTTAVKPVTVQDLAGPNHAYQAYAAGVLARLARQVTVLEKDLRQRRPGRARTAWLAAQLDWERAGASYDSFGADGLAVDGLPDGLALGVRDPHFTGLHRLEYGLWHGQHPAVLLRASRQLARSVAAVRRHLTSGDLTGDPTNLPIRAHEILEDALRDHLSGIDNEGAGAAYPETYADVQVTRVVLGELAGLITARAPRLVPMARAQLATLQQALLATRSRGQWRAPAATPLVRRQHVDAAIGALLQTLSAVPDLLEVPPAH